MELNKTERMSSGFRDDQASIARHQQMQVNDNRKHAPHSEPQTLPVPSRRFLVLERSKSGLTSCLNALQLGPVQVIMLGTGFKHESVRYGNIEFLSWSTEGCRPDYPDWYQCFSKVCGIIQVVDVADASTSLEAFALIQMCEELFAAAKHLDHIPLLVVGNKADLLTAMRKQELDYNLSLRNIRRPWTSCMTNCQTGQGKDEVLRWVVEAINLQAGGVNGKEARMQEKKCR